MVTESDSLRLKIFGVIATLCTGGVYLCWIGIMALSAWRWIGASNLLALLNRIHASPASSIRLYASVTAAS